MNRPRLSDRVQIPDDVIFRDLQGEAIILNLTTGTYFGLNEVGTRAWTEFAAAVTLDAVVETLTREYDVDRRTAERDGLELVEALAVKGLIVVGADGAARSRATAVRSARRRSAR